MIKGSRVRIKALSIIEGMTEQHGWQGDRSLGDIIFQRPMKKYCPLNTRIKEICINHQGIALFQLEDTDHYWWHEDWLHDMGYQTDWPEGAFEIC